MPLNDEQLDLDSLNPKQLNQLTQKWPKNLAELVSIVGNRLAKEKLDKPLLAEKLITDISIYLGGRAIYLPRGRSLSGFLRNLRIYQAFNGSNADELAKEHGLSRGYCGGMI
jgi:Mor family transcriptional regulator